jgi:phage terminase large subunit
LKIKLPDRFQPLFKPKRIKVFFGGRGGAKTESFIRAALVLAIRDGKRFLCLREFMNSIDDSVHAAIKGIIASDGFQGFTELEKRIDGPNGSGFKYGQLARNLSSIKSKFDFDVAWIEEAETITTESIETLEPTIRKDGSELWYSFNPAREDGAVYTKYVLPYIDEINRAGFYEDDDVYVCKIGIEHNPWAPESLLRAAEKMKAENYDLWCHVWDGQPRRDLDDVIIQPKWIDAAIDAHKTLGWQGVGVKSLGFDPADAGSDAKAIAIRHGSLITEAKSWTTGDITSAIPRAFDAAEQVRATHIVFDADGLGAAVKVGLDQRVGSDMDITAYHGGASVDYPAELYEGNRSNKDTFKNKRAQYYWFLADRFRKTYDAVVNGVYCDPEQLISISSDIGEVRQIKAELSRVLRKRTNNSQIQLESKPDMAKRGVKSPNLADAIVMCFANPPPKTVHKKQEFAALW